MRRRAVAAAVLLSALGASRLASASEPAEEPDRQEASPGTIIRGFASGGASRASLLGLSSTALHLDAGVGFEQNGLYFPIGVNVELGQTPGGLSAGEVTLGAGAQGVMGRFRLGAGVDLGYGWIGRAPTSPLPHIGICALDLFALATFDVVDLGNHRALYLGVKPSGGARWGESFFAFGHGTLTWRGAALAGVRF